MNNKYVFAVVALVVGFAAGWFVAPQITAKLGTASAYQALNQQALLTELNAINTDAVAVRASIAATKTTTSTGFATLGMVAAPSSTTTTILTLAGAALGDGAFCTDNSTSSDYSIIGTAASGTIRCQIFNTSTSAQGVSTGTITAYDIPSASFLTPGTLTQ